MTIRLNNELLLEDILEHFRGQTHDEIADILEWDQATVSRIITQLKKNQKYKPHNKTIVEICDELNSEPLRYLVDDEEVDREGISMNKVQIVNDIIRLYDLPDINGQGDVAERFGTRQGQLSNWMRGKIRSSSLAKISNGLGNEPEKYLKLSYDTPFSIGDSNVLLISGDILRLYNLPEVKNQNDLVRKLGMNHKAEVSKLVRGVARKPHISTIKKVSAATGREMIEYYLTLKQAAELNKLIGFDPCSLRKNQSTPFSVGDINVSLISGDVLRLYTLPDVNCQDDVGEMLGVKQGQVSRLLRGDYRKLNRSTVKRISTVADRKMNEYYLTLEQTAELNALMGFDPCSLRQNNSTPFSVGDSNVSLISGDVLRLYTLPDVNCQDDVAKMLGVNQAQVSRLLKGDYRKLNHSTVERVSAATGRDKNEYVLTPDQADELNTVIGFDPLYYLKENHSTPFLAGDTNVRLLVDDLRRLYTLPNVNGQEDIAEMLGVHQAQVSRLLKGDYRKLNHSTVERVSAATGRDKNEYVLTLEQACELNTTMGFEENHSIPFSAGDTNVPLVIEDIRQLYTLPGVDDQTDIAKILGVNQSKVSMLLKGDYRKLHRSTVEKVSAVTDRDKNEYVLTPEQADELNAVMGFDPLHYLKKNNSTPFSAGDTNVRLLVDDIRQLYTLPGVDDQTDIAEKLDTDQTQVSRLLKGNYRKLHRSTVERISAATNRNIAEYVLTPEQADELNDLMQDNGSSVSIMQSDELNCELQQEEDNNPWYNKYVQLCDELDHEPLRYLTAQYDSDKPFLAGNTNSLLVTSDLIKIRNLPGVYDQKGVARKLGMRCQSVVSRLMRGKSRKLHSSTLERISAVTARDRLEYVLTSEQADGLNTLMQDYSSSVSTMQSDDLLDN